MVPWFLDRLKRRICPIGATVVFFVLALLYTFRWGPVVQHVPSTWLSPEDQWSTYFAAVAFVHGKFGTVYSTSTGFLAFPGILIVLAPVAALGTSLHTSLVEVEKHHRLVAHPETFLYTGNATIPHGPIVNFTGGLQLAPHPVIFEILAPYELLLAAVALFACDALAERLGARGARRAALAVAEAIILWNISVRWGHPQDALAVAFCIYAVLFAIDGRFTGAGWLFGLGLAFQPLAIVVLPLLVALGGKERAVGLVVRGVVPAAVVTVPPLAGDFHSTVHAITSQAAYPTRNHATPWTFLAPKLTHTGSKSPAVGGGPVRLISLALAVVLGWWSRRWRNRPEMIAWALALALALRCYTESVMTDYYVWPALAVAVVVASRADFWRFAVVVAAAFFASVSAQWHLGEFPWWIIEMSALTVVLVGAAWPAATPEVAAVEVPAPREMARTAPRRAAPASKKKSRKADRVNRKRSGRR